MLEELLKKKKEPLKIARICSYCKDHTHLIDPSSYPNDKYAKEDPPYSGRWKCGNCLDRELEDRILDATPGSQRAQEILVKRQRELDKKLKQDEYNHRMRQLSSRPVVRTCNDPNCEECSIARRRVMIR
jgi:hypothetical protein